MSHSKVAYTSRGEGEYTDSSEDELWDQTAVEQSNIGENLVPNVAEEPNQDINDQNLVENLTMKAKRFVQTFGWRYEANEKDYQQFFEGFKIDQIYPHDASGYGRGVCYFEFDHENEVSSALLKDHCFVGKRYIRVRKIDERELDELLKHVELNQPYENDSFIRIWDLDPKIGKNEIAKFLDESDTKFEAFIKLKDKIYEEVIFKKKIKEKLCGRKTKNPKNWKRNELIDPLRCFLKNIKSLVEEEKLDIHTLLDRSLRYITMIERKLQSEAAIRENQEKLIEDLSKRIIN
uniref:RRM domain-containing protein n=1 Tax=Acrobeloides nanus TaxID=290746 RepID=A0A914E8E9_9BILA